MDKTLEDSLRAAAAAGALEFVAPDLLQQEIVMLLAEIDSLRQKIKDLEADRMIGEISNDMFGQVTIRTLRAEVARLREALAEYASESNWTYRDGWLWNGYYPRLLAQAALKEARDE